MVADALLTLKEVTKKYGNRVVLSEISLSIGQGESIILRGSNGSGKSTLLRIVTGLIPLTTGQRALKHSKLVIGYTPDRLSKLRMTSTEYLTHMGKIAKVPRNDLQERIKELHTFFHLEQSKSLKMTHFSKGMLQKVNLMQATIKTPDLLVLDEPFSGLDKESIEHLLASLKRIKEKGTSILAAVHDPLLASQLESRTYWIRQGRLREEHIEASQSPSVTLFELECVLTQEELYRLTSLFPEVTWKIDDNGQIKFVIMQKDYHGFMIELVHRGVEIITLQRKEMAS
ncbi:ABC transporter ATP-binding protein [Paenibacillus thiaminolyticus]|uniref:ABC transporter ATP-binding protein n=1 Tax=Paenibacillus thiaminolyticus TaxID=49283 RepID=A0AAP9DSF5_PANTH|nr:ABC transporter ATP-binding protein [Paenibacillus thiaminolyticus]MCY9538250.1 ABC transporter ATP-binding protein [Paenibacillus thiaminolyticus]MCY9601631.1 ABC transporter ATP-binding protein [Paenibacillus thiaminolyticus]MCY9609056.1 ABC transporter ATP-binding protein [Paenibacillus thiaminolyticus]MCY9615561.1 ABC transporter ATP-binding protein [Paenibacillus thiaminolyticus]MCY9620363.1 ABC transporter ATP-binding protein [Paenibacillus thiaminolyticus]